MNVAAHDAAAIVSRALACVPASDRPALMRELLAYTAAALTILESRPKAAETVYQLADAMVMTGVKQNG